MENIKEYGYLGENILSNKNQVARILAVHKERYEVVCQQAKCFATLKSSVYYNNCVEQFPTVGDFVLIDYNSNGESRIVKTLERKSFFSRVDPSSSGHAAQAVAANFDYVFIMMSLNNNFNINRIERYLTLAWQSGATPVIVLTKADLVEDYSKYITELETIAFGVEICPISVQKNTGLQSLDKYLQKGKTAVFLGSSGVGKSSLVNYLCNGEVMAVKAIRETDCKGKHTTSHRQLIKLENGAMIIDTPGMRELGMWCVDDGLVQSFEDVEKYFSYCKFADCTHTNEPHCAVREAIENGELALDRWQNFLKLKNEAKYSASRESYLNEKEEFFKKISIQNKNNKKRI